MFEKLTERLTSAFGKLRGQKKLTEENIKEVLRSVQLSLLEADVALPVVKSFISTIKEKAIGQAVEKLNPEQFFIKLVQQELTAIMGETFEPLQFNAQPPTVILLAGLQGSGKTTSAAKLAKYLQENEKKKVMLVSVDIYRPAAITQLEKLAEQVSASFYSEIDSKNPVKIAKNAIEQAKKQYIDTIIVDTAGRLHIDDDMMAEIKQLHQATHPVETLFVIDSMTGQDAVNTAKAFHDALPLTGLILTKADGDARGGAALSARYITQKPIKFIGVGEKIDALEPFHPERLASRILGMGDVLSLIEDVERKTDKAASDKLKKKLKKGKPFDLDDFKEQLLQLNKMGGVAGIIGKLPGLSQLPAEASAQMNDGTVRKTVAIISSMTDKERRIPKIIIGSRKRRIADGSGTQIADVNRLLKQFEKMQKMMQKIKKPGAMKKMMQGMGSLGGFKDQF